MSRISELGPSVFLFFHLASQCYLSVFVFQLIHMLQLHLLMPLLLLIATQGQRASVKIGVVLPFYIGPKQPSYSGMRHLAAVQMAVDAVNSDSIILPNTLMKYTVRESRGSPGPAAVATQSLIASGGVDVILAGGEDLFAVESVVSDDIALVGHMASASKLSDTSVYPNVVQMSISNDIVANGVAAFVSSEVIDASHVSIISGSDIHSNDLAQSFLRQVPSYDMHVIASTQITAGSTQVLESVSAFFSGLKVHFEKSSRKTGQQYLILLFAQAADTINVLKAAHSIGISSDVVTWILSESVLDESNTFQDALGDDLDSIMTGSFVVHADNGRGGAAYESLWNKWRSMHTTAGTPENGADESSSSTYGVKGTGPTCNTAVDSDGNDVHMFDDDGNAATRKSCGGVNFATDVEFTKTLTFYVPFVYDSIFLIAQALHDLIEVQNVQTFTATELVGAMKRVSFPGVSGGVELDSLGSRSLSRPHSCIVSSFDAKTKVVDPVGTVRFEKNSSSTGATIFRLNDGASLVYSSVDGTKPNFYPSVKHVYSPADEVNPLVVVVACAIPLITIFIATLIVQSKGQSKGRTWSGFKLKKRQLRLDRLNRVLLQNKSFHCVAQDVTVGSTYKCHRSTWFAEKQLVDVALLVLRDNSNLEKTEDKVTALVDEVHFMNHLQQHPNILHCYGMLLEESSTNVTISKESKDNSRLFNHEALVFAQIHHSRSFKNDPLLLNDPQNDVAPPTTKSTAISSQLAAALSLGESPSAKAVEMTTGTSLVALVMEWCEHGSLDRMLREKRTHLTLAMRLQIASELAHGVKSLHNQKSPIAHPNLITSNVYITIDFRVKIGGCFPRHSHKMKYRNDSAELSANIASLAAIMRKLLSPPSSANDLESGGGPTTSASKSASIGSTTAAVVPSSLNDLVLLMENQDLNLRPNINEVVRQVDMTLVDLRSRTFLTAESMSTSMFDTVWSKAVNRDDPQQLQVDKPSSVFVDSSTGKKLVAPEDLHVLLVDDDDFALASMQHALEMCHYSVTGCNSGIKAMDFLCDKPNKYDVVLSDAFMPAMNGLSLLGAIKNDPALRHTPVVLVSSSTTQIMQALKLGARDYLVKPLRVFEAMTLFPKVKMWRIQMGNEFDDQMLAGRLAGRSSASPAPLSTTVDAASRGYTGVSGGGNNGVRDGDGASSGAGAGADAGSDAGADTFRSPSPSSSSVKSKTTDPGVNIDAIQMLIAGNFSKDVKPTDIGIPIIAWNDLELHRLAGMGSGGCVFEGVLLNGGTHENGGTDRSVACKRFNRGNLKMNRDAVKCYIRELELLSMLHHPNIMELIGIAEHDEFVWHICEYVQFGSLAEVLQEPNVAHFLTISKRIDVLLGVAEALNYMHSQTPTLIHRDIKPSNILLSHDLTAKLSDFAYSRSITGARKMTRCGTPAYVAPEVMLGQAYDESVDTYAFGVVFWQMITRAKPFAAESDPVSILKKTSSGERCEFPSFDVCSSFPGNSDLNETCYSSFADLTQVCWHQDPAMRPSMVEVIRKLSAVKKNESLGPDGR